MLNVERMVNLYHLLSQVLAFDVAGEVADLGCHKGQSAILLQAILDYHASSKPLHVYDSFLGLPAHHVKDSGAVLPQASLRVDRADLVDSFLRAEATMPVIHEGWLEDTIPSQLPPQLCFAHIDVDLYGSTKHALACVYPRLTRGAIVVIDDYDWSGLPGINCAVDEFLADKPERLCRMRLGSNFDATHAFFRRV